MRAHTLSAAVAVSILSALVSMTPANAQDGTRTVTGPEAGACIFSTQVMPKDRFSDPAYRKVKTVFTPGEPIAARCFYENGAQDNYKSLGSQANTMRDSGKYFAEFEWTNENSRGSFSDFRIKAVNHNFRQGWTQQRYDLTSDFAECDFKLKGSDKSKYRAKPDGCMDFAGFIQSRGISNPGQQEFCIRIFMKFANSKQWRTVGNDRRYEPVYVEKTMARGCFKVDLGGGSGSAMGASKGAPTTRVSIVRHNNAALAADPAMPQMGGHFRATWGNVEPMRGATE